MGGRSKASSKNYFYRQQGQQTEETKVTQQTRRALEKNLQENERAKVTKAARWLQQQKKGDQLELVLNQLRQQISGLQQQVLDLNNELQERDLRIMALRTERDQLERGLRDCQKRICQTQVHFHNLQM